VQITDDDVDEDSETIVLTTTVNGLTVTDVTLTITDDDTAAVTVSESAALLAADATAEYTVVLGSQPTAAVTITPTSGTVAAATVSGPLTFSTTDWETPQTVTVSAVATGETSITHGATSADATYRALSIDPVAVTVDPVRVDKTEAAVVVGGVALYTVVLAAQPAAEVTVTPTSSDETKATVSGAVTFSTTDWNTAQTITVSGVATGAATVGHPVTSSDQSYNAITAQSVEYRVLGTPTTLAALVSNLGQSSDGLGIFANGNEGWVNAQGFATGGNAAGYVFSGIDLVLQQGLEGSGATADTAVNRAKFKAELWSATGGSGGVPEAKIVDLTVPASLATGTRRFTADSAVSLDPSTTYFFVIYVADSDSARTIGNRLKVRPTFSDAEDSGAATGWSINDIVHRIRGADTPTGTWTTDRAAWKIAVHGITAPLPDAVPPPDPSTLVLTTDVVGGSVSEDVVKVQVTATLDEAATSDVVVTLAAGPATTAAADEYTLPAAFTIVAGETAESADVTIIDDEADEVDDVLELTARSPA